jgi:hypothetical protein
VASLLLHPEGFFTPFIQDTQTPEEEAEAFHITLSALLDANVPMGHWCQRGAHALEKCLRVPAPDNVWQKGVSVQVLRGVLYHEIKAAARAMSPPSLYVDKMAPQTHARAQVPLSLLGRVDAADVWAYAVATFYPMRRDFDNWTLSYHRDLKAALLQWMFASLRENTDVMRELGAWYDRVACVWRPASHDKEVALAKAKAKAK